MTREEAINEIRTWAIPSEKGREVLETLIPELKENENERVRKEIINFFKNFKETGTWKSISDVNTWIAYLEKQKDASKAIEAVDRIDRYIDEHVANAHDMKDSNPDKKYYRGWDDALGKMSGILQDVYSGKKQKEQKTTNELEDAFKYYTDRGITISCGDFKAEPKKEQNDEYEECTNFTIYHPFKNGKGEYECIPYSFYGSLTSFSEGKDLIDFLRTCFYTKEECNEWIKQQQEQKPVRTAKQVWKEMRLEVYAQASGNRHEPNCSDNSTKMFSLYDIDEIFEKIGDSTVGPQKPIECIEFDNEFEKQVSYLLASVLNGEWEYNEGFVKHVAQSLLGYAKNELKPAANVQKINPNIVTETHTDGTGELDGKALLYTADKSYQIGFRDGVASVKPEWSEEDGKTINDACCWIAEYAGYLMDKNYGKASMLMGLTDKLKSLRPIHWKPSEHQMNILKAVKDYVSKGSGYWGEGLGSLIEDLEKL